jgi:hypothetical protein
MKKNLSIGAPVSRKMQTNIAGGAIVLISRTSCRITAPDGTVSIVRNCNCAVVLLLPGYNCETVF